MELKARCKERFEPVVQAIRQLQKEKEGLDEPLIVAIDGRCGSGKTTLGEYLEQVFDCNLFRMDDFFSAHGTAYAAASERNRRKCGL